MDSILLKSNTMIVEKDLINFFTYLCIKQAFFEQFLACTRWRYPFGSVIPFIHHFCCAPTLLCGICLLPDTRVIPNMIMEKEFWCLPRYIHWEPILFQSSAESDFGYFAFYYRSPGPTVSHFKCNFNKIATEIAI